MSKMLCEKCEKTLKKDDIILLIKKKNQQVVNVKACHREQCHDELEKEKISEGFSCGFYEMNTSLKDCILEDEFMRGRFTNYALKNIKKYCSGVIGN